MNNLISCFLLWNILSLSYIATGIYCHSIVLIIVLSTYHQLSLLYIYIILIYHYILFLTTNIIILLYIFCLLYVCLLQIRNRVWTYAYLIHIIILYKDYDIGNHILLTMIFECILVYFIASYRMVSYCIIDKSKYNTRAYEENKWKQDSYANHGNSKQLLVQI